ncbi:hypothetical protein Barb7_01138 [Bacteroidales bacterium Barb7]|nr:hypothetical protein Barb7_01138 [Bacteroidales bacterium Barb7]
MNLKLPERILQIIEELKTKFFNNPRLEQRNSKFYSLSPTDKIENGDCYFDALSWALTNRKEKSIKNIALTGPYGSGKSSILQSFQKVNADKHLHFLNISLATFKEEKKPEDKTEGENLQRLIELSILQQLFYREKDRKLPDSRLKKITTFSWTKLLLSALGCLVFMFSLVLLLKPQILPTILPNVTISETVKIVIHYVSLIFSIIGIFFIAVKSIRILHNLKISKLNIKNAEIEISDNINKSVLNHNLEEILYFFEATDYNVIIFEDLDRFQETEIFTKLREINLLINNSKKINKDIVFIYAIRDEMFSNKDRTKFFDFIIPVIPVINYSNSNEILLKEIKAIAGNVSESLINDLSLFIDEMRVLYNIINEFQIYKQLLSKELSQDKMLAMIVYKNICPCDFVKLSNYEGDLYDTINKKHEYIKQQSEHFDKIIAENKEEIQKLEALKIKDIKELRALYILQYVGQLTGFNTFSINDVNYNYIGVIQDDIFAYFIADKVSYSYQRQGYSYILNDQVSLKFKDVEKQVDSKYTYEEREQQITEWNNNKINELKQKIALLEQQKNESRHETIGNLLSNKSISVKTTDNRQTLISLLLRNGYIDENYLDYISLFHEGSLSKKDYLFLSNVKAQMSTVFNHSLDNIGNLIRKIHIYDFQKEYILNYDLVDFVLSNARYQEQKEAIFNLLRNESKTSMEFIGEFIKNGINIDIFIRELSPYWSNIWNYIVHSSDSDMIVYSYLKLIVEKAQISSIKIISDNSNLKQYIAELPGFCNISSNEEKIKQVLKVLDIKFEDIITDIISDKLLNYIYQNNHYQIIPIALETMIQTKGNFNQVDFDTRNYYAILNSQCDVLITYIEGNIQEYIDNVYLELETNTKEEEESLIKLLNNENINETAKTAIIQKVETKVSTLSKIDAGGVENLLLENSKLIPNWTDIVDKFVSDGNTISMPVLLFINDITNAQELSKYKIDKNKPLKETVDVFLETILLEDKITDISYSNILNSIPCSYNRLAFENLSQPKVELLIENNILELNERNYTLLRDNFGLHIDLIEKRHYELTDELLDTLNFDNANIVSVLKSQAIPKKNKQQIFDLYREQDIINSAEILEILPTMVQYDSISVNKNILMAILTKTKNTDKILELYIKKSNELNNDDITDFLQSLPEPYSNIAENGKRPFIEKNRVNLKFAKVLRLKNYISKIEIEKKGIRISTFRNE